MNAIDSATETNDPRAVTDVDSGARLARLLFWTAVAATSAIAAAAAGGLPVTPSLIATFAVLAGASATWCLAWTRRRSRLPPAAPAPRRRLARLLPPRTPKGDMALLGRAARWPQAIIVVPCVAAGVAVAWMLHADPASLAPRLDFLLGGGAFVLAFPLLIAERSLGQAKVTAALPEASALRSLFFLLLLCLAGTGLLSFAAGFGFTSVAREGLRLLALTPLLVALELALRALGLLFLPPPQPAEARAAATSALAQILAEGVADRALAAPLRRHLGLDFSRGWALAFIRAALPTVALCLAGIVWGMTGVVLVPADQRAIHEHFGAPVAVLSPGLHIILPWPLGRVRRVEFGPLHAMPLGDAGAAPPLFGAEDNPPPSADRLWEQAHPAELSFLIASENAGRQNFQIVSADIKVVWRVGLTDGDALRATYAVADPPTLVRGAASRAIAAFFAGETLPSVMGDARDAVAGRLRDAIQAELKRADAGIELASVVIEAVHPPAGAADAYHAVQAAEIGAVTQISAERGRAEAEAAKAAQFAADILGNAHARAADMTTDALSRSVLFAADVQASRSGGASFPLNRYLTDVAAALTVTPLTIIDHRIPASDAPLLDLRPFSEPAAPTGAE
jgi:regulator of protease activity HflC (stomatin/prohibitin superfamily)